MYDQNQSSGTAMPGRDASTGELPGSGSSTWGTERGEQWQPAATGSTGTQGQFQSETAGHSQSAGSLGFGQSGASQGGGQSAASQGSGASSGTSGDMAGQATAAVDQGIDKASEGLGQAASIIRERGEQMGATGGAGSTVSMVADQLDAASAYLRDRDSSQLISDLEKMVREKPTQSLLIAAGVGFLLSKILR